jgi:hypothetical protein
MKLLGTGLETYILPQDAKISNERMNELKSHGSCCKKILKISNTG